MPSSAINNLFKGVEPRLKRAFLAAIKDANDGVDMARLKDAIRRRNYQDALSSINLSPASFNGLKAEIAATYEAGGTAASRGLKGARDAEGHAAVIRFDVRDTLTERLINSHVTQLVGDITADMRNAIRSALEAGLAEGKGPLAVARDIAGYWDAKKQQRVGGVLGLTNAQEQRVLKAATELQNNPKAFLQRPLAGRDARRMIERAARSGEPLTDSQIAKILAKYRSDLLLDRAETVARTEAMSALHEGQREMYEQAIRDGYVTGDEIEREWSASGDNRVRESHVAIDGETVGFGEAYSNGLMFPGDPNGPAEEVINCRCYEIIRVNYLNRIDR